MRRKNQEQRTMERDSGMHRSISLPFQIIWKGIANIIFIIYQFWFWISKKSLTVLERFTYVRCSVFRSFLYVNESSTYAERKRRSSRYMSLYREPFHLNKRRVKPPAVELATSLWYEIVMMCCQRAMTRTLLHHIENSIIGIWYVVTFSYVIPSELGIYYYLYINKK